MKLYLKNARLSFTASLFDARQVNGQGEAKFSVASIIIPGETTAYFGEKNPDSAVGRELKLQWGDPKEACSAAIMWAAGRQGKWKGKELDTVKALKASDRLFLHDGDAKAETPGFKGNLFINSSNKVRPAVVDARGEPVTAASGIIYAGCYAYVTLEPWAQDNQFGKRVNASLLMVGFIKDGERLAGGSVASADDYAAIPEQAAQAAQTSGQGAAALF